MPVKFVLSPKVNSLKETKDKRYFPRAIKRDVINLTQLSEQIAHASSLTRSDMYGSLIALTEHLAMHLAEGNIVRMGDFGSFQISLRGKGAETPDVIGKNLITDASITFRPGTDLKKMLNELEFERVKKV